MEFRGTVELGGKTATGIAVPDDVVAALGGGRRPAVTVTLGGHSYRTTVARMGGRYLVPLNAANREAAGVRAGDEVHVAVELDTAPREVEVPEDLRVRLAVDTTAGQFFDQLSFTHRKEWVQWVTEAKTSGTRASRVDRTVEALREGRRTR
jgi:Domain of unknown function (DUF1905)/Bacteriocin-protection, YdeI or OmpD-Associated